MSNPLDPQNGESKENIGQNNYPPDYINKPIYISGKPPNLRPPEHSGGFKPPSGYTPEPDPSLPLKPFGFPNQSRYAKATLKANFFHRAIASIFDLVIFLPFACILNTIFETQYKYSDVPWQLVEPDNSTNNAIIIVTVLYHVYAVFMVRNGQTLGDRIMNIRVIDEYGNPPGLNRTLARFALPFAVAVVTYFVRSDFTPSLNMNNLMLLLGGFTGLFLWIGYLWMIGDPDKQTFYDKLAGTYVVQVWGD